MHKANSILKREYPEHEHDCNVCELLGKTIGGGRIVDLYIHKNRQRPHTLVARYGNISNEYYSCEYGRVHPTGHSELWAAQCIAKERGI